MKPCNIWHGATSNGRPMRQKSAGSTKLVQVDREEYCKFYNVKIPSRVRLVKTCGNSMCIEPTHMEVAEPKNPRKAEQLRKWRQRTKRETIGQAAARRQKQLDQAQTEKQAQLAKEEARRRAENKANAESSALRAALKKMQP